MKKYLICADTHLGFDKSSDIWLDVSTNFFIHIVEYCLKNDIDTIIHLGDFFHNRKSLSSKTIHIAHKIAKLLKTSKINLKILLGNHDCYYRENNKINTLIMFKEYKNIDIIDKIKVLDDFLFVPWSCDDFEEYENKVVLGHFDIIGFEMSAGNISKEGIDPKVFRKHKMVFSGHYHNLSNHDNIVYVGSPYQMNFGDAINPNRGFIVYESIDNWKRVCYKDSPKLIKMNANKIDEENIEGNIIKLTFTDRFELSEINDIIEKVQSNNPLQFYTDYQMPMEIDDSEITNDEELDNINLKNLFNKYIDSIKEFPEGIDKNKVNSIFEKMYKEIVS